MKRTIASIAVMAGSVLGSSGCLSPNGKTQTKQQPDAQPAMAKAETRKDPSTGFIQATAFLPKSATPTQGHPMGQPMVDPAVRQVNFGQGGPALTPETLGPIQSKMGAFMGHGGIYPVPGQAPPGAVAGVGFGGPGHMGAAYSNQRTSIRFAKPEGMKIAFSDGRGFGDTVREAPVRYNFPQSNIYRIRISDIANRPGKFYYPTLEVYPSTMKTVTFLSHSTVPIAFTDEDFEQANAGNLVVKVIYLPDPQFQDLAAAEEIVSTRLEAGVDPIAEANRRGTILAVVRLGNIDLEDKTTPAMDQPSTFGGQPMMRMMPNPNPPLKPVQPEVKPTPTPMPKLGMLPTDLPNVNVSELPKN